MNILLLVVLLVNTEVCRTANILAILPYPGKSHFNVFERLLKELAARGHDVDVVSHFPSNKVVARYNDLSIKGSLPICTNNMTVGPLRNMNTMDLMNMVLGAGGTNLCDAVFNSKIGRDLRNSTKKYDLLMVHYFGSNCFLGYAHLFNVPAIAITSSVNLPWTSSLIGLPDNPSYVPLYFSSHLPKMSFIERLENTMFYILANIWFEVASNTRSNTLARKYFGPKLPSLESIARNVSLVMVNSHFSIHQARPAVPNFLEIGGIHIKENTTLPAYFNKALKTDTKGIIYLSFGSMILTESFPEEKLRALFQSLGKLPYKVLWKADREKFPNNVEIPDNIQFEPWMPQLPILCHPNVKLFISHGGMLGTLEALYCGVPIMGIPIFADQALNLRNTVNRGVAVQVSYDEISEETITSALGLILNNPTYKENILRLSALFKDRATSALDSAIYWTEYVIRHNGAPHLKSIGADLPWYQYYLLDVIGAFIIFGFTTLFTLYSLFMFVFVKLMLVLKGIQKLKIE